MKRAIRFFVIVLLMTFVISLTIMAQRTSTSRAGGATQTKPSGGGWSAPSQPKRPDPPPAAAPKKEGNSGGWGAPQPKPAETKPAAGGWGAPKEAPKTNVAPPLQAQPTPYTAGRTSDSTKAGAERLSPGQEKKPWTAATPGPQAQQKLSQADQKLVQQAKANGTLYNNRTDAVNNFKQKYASQYTSKYATEPATRPDHIPQTYQSGGNTYNISYNRQYGGYGYMVGSTWYGYDPFLDLAMADMLMHRHAYVHNTYPAVAADAAYQQPGQPTVVVQQGHGFGFYLIWTVVVLGIIAIIITVIIKS